MGVGGYHGWLRSPTLVVPSEGRQWGSRWAISGRMFASPVKASQRLRAAKDASSRGWE